MSTYETVYRAYRSRFDAKKLFEAEEEAKEFDLIQALTLVGRNKLALDVSEFRIAAKVLHDAIKEREVAAIIAEYNARQAECSIMAEAEAAAPLAAAAE